MSKEPVASSKGAPKASSDSSCIDRALPKRIRIREVGLREGFQTIKEVIPTQEKLRLVKMLNNTGIKQIELTSFVRPDKVPQMADAAALVESYERCQGVRYTALYLNQRGFELALKSSRLEQEGWVQAACSESFLKHNAATSLSQIVSELPQWQAKFSSAGLKFHGIMLSTAFGCSYEGEVSTQRLCEVITQLRDALSEPLSELCLADTMGWGNPKMISERVELARQLLPQTEISLHLHDTRGLGLANAYAGLMCGVVTFDASLGGVGGCPFAPGAAGNIATEDLAYLCHGLGIETGLDLKRYIEVVQALSDLLGYPLPGHLYRAGLSTSR